MVSSGSECDVRPRRCLQVVCVGSLSRHVCSLCGDVQAKVQDVRTWLGEKGREEGHHELYTIGCRPVTSAEYSMPDSFQKGYWIPLSTSLRECISIPSTRLDR